MTRKPPPQTSTETPRELIDVKRKHTQQTPPWPGAKEQAKPQPAGTPPAPSATPGKPAVTPPSKAGYERSDINKRHH